jgi:hypothetical protein
MKLTYTVSKEKGSNRWYAHKVGYSYIPCIIDGCPTFGTKKEALHNAAMMMGLSYKDYMSVRRKSENSNL